MEVIVFGVLLALYLIPTFVAHGKKCFAPVLVLNLFLGWTFLGWVIALVWAVSSDE